MKNFKMLSRAEMRNVAGGYMCEEGQFDCGDGMCIDQRQIMDGVADCRNGNDENVGGPCDDWRSKPAHICLSCCLTVHNLDYCSSQC